MITSRQTVSDRLAHTIREQKRQIISEHRISDGRLHAHTRGTSSEDQIFDPKILEDRIQFGLIEAAESMFVQHGLAGLRLKFGDNIRIPSIPYQYSTFGTVGRTNDLSDAESQMPHPVRRIRRT
jgi:hypothetical protein